MQPIRFLRFLRFVGLGVAIPVAVAMPLGARAQGAPRAPDARAAEPRPHAARPPEARPPAAHATGARPQRSQPQGAGYAGTQACLECHKKESAPFLETAKGRLFTKHPRGAVEKLGCESCHGPGKQHAESGGDEPGALVSFSRKSKTPVLERNAICLQCHEKTARTLWKGSSHESRNVACTDCHRTMHAYSERGNLAKATVAETCGGCHKQRVAQQARFSHMPVAEGKLECSGCHNPHGSPNDKLLIAPSANETCFACHAEKRGPFLWQHPPVVESCGNCHDPHGTSKEKLLRVAKPRLCQQCHDPTQHPTQPRGTTTADARFVRGRQCVDCHAMIHGSNHPSGKRFTR